ncbi:MAG: DUF3368 domain-containing protein [Planctomycetes bacterium]|nr:DUF3368 domain-containing protein [Planctomycetota bacterium]MBL7044543.1 DUF3368 domain-containing protein [Pirellulaceae bacterium]
MNEDNVVSNSSPLIALDQIGRLAVLSQLFDEVTVPPAVVRETNPLLILPPWVIEQPLTQPIGAQVLAASLGAGEREAICLAIESSADWIILDDRPARRLAASLDLPMVGTLGILLAAKRRGLLAEIRPCLDELIRHDFFMTRNLYEQVLTQAGESP